MDIIKEIESLKRQHYYCEDTWYNCPMHPDGCANEYEPLKCNCGADEHNDRVDKIIEVIYQEYLMDTFNKISTDSIHY